MSKPLQESFEFAGARNTDPQTSHDAAARVDGKGLCEMVLTYLLTVEDATAHEVAEALGLSLVTVSPRFKPLEGMRLIERTGERRDRRQTWRAVR